MPCITELLRYFPNEKSGFGSFRSQLFDSTNIYGVEYTEKC